MNKRNLLFLAVLLSAGIMLLSSCKDDDPTTAKIHGTIEFENSIIWPLWIDSGEVQVTIFPEFSLDPSAGWGEIPDNHYFPGSVGGFFPVGAPYNSQDPFVLTYNPLSTSYDYELEVEPGIYSVLAVGFRKDDVSDPNRRTAPMGVHWNNPDTKSYGIVLKVDVGGGNIVTIFDDPAPETLDLKAGDDLTINFKADFSIVPAWYSF